MKKIISIILAAMLVIGMAGCSGTEQTFEVTSIVNKDGKEFVPALTQSGTTGKIALDSKSFELCGKTYELPIKISDLLNDGWEFSTQFKNEFKPKIKTSLVSFTLKNADGAIIDFHELYNDTDEVQKIEDCWLTGIGFNNLDSSASKLDIMIPGGISKTCTAGDVVAKFGDPNNSELFTEYSYNLEKQLSYNNHKDSGMSFSFTFDESGAISTAKITANIEKEFASK